MLSSKEVNAIGQILNNTWGRGDRKVDYNLQDNMFLLRYQTIVHFASEKSLQVQSPRLSEESGQILKDVLAGLKKQFKEITGNTLKLKERFDRDSIELISATSVNPRKIAYYTRRIEFLVEN